MPKLNIKFKGIIIERFIVTLIGIICVLLLLELFLRIIGLINLGSTDYQILSNSYNDSHIVLCLGDSWTFGIGAPYGKDYPSQLETILNSMSLKKKFKIINRGAGGHNTTQILNELTNILGKNIKPELVIFLGGEANEWNYRGYNLYLKGNRLSSIINDYLYRIRIYKLAKLLFKNVSEKIQDKSPAGIIHNSSFANTNINQFRHLNNDNFKKDDKENTTKDTTNYIDPYRVGLFCRSNQQYDEAIKSFKKCLGINPNAVECYAGIGGVYTDQEQYDEAIKWLKKGIDINPKAIECYEGMGFVYKAQQQYDEAIKWFKKAIALNPGFRQIVATCYCIMKNQDKKEFLNELSKDYRLPQGFIDMLKASSKGNINDEVNRWKIHDIEKTIRICKENKIKIMLLDYPKPCAMNDTLCNIAKVNSVPFLDNDKIFRQLWNTGERRGDYFSADGHCNAKGYAMMAKNIFNRIVQDKIFNFD
jgi:tetratricopeptide (TPR) repeat protein